MQKYLLVSVMAGLVNLPSLVCATNFQALSSPEAEAVLLYHAQSVDAAQAVLHDGKLSRATTQYYNNTDKAKIDILFGKWQLQYKDTTSHSDALELDSTVNDSNFGYYGWDGKHSFSCFYEPGIVGTSYSYQCLHMVDANAGIAQRYLFNLNGNTLTGKYFSGTVTQFLDAIKNNQLIDLSGSNSSPVVSTDPNYDDTSKILNIPKVTAFGNSYRATLVNEGNGLFRLKTVNPL